ncbi:unnamed protein product [Sphagnum jensenii]|uniref:Coiled-coil domain-containing protein 61 n=1 Tax=Sphagnum jensenii TaxID=128206 RepID=A0ABP1A2F5_9BRYO
MSHGGSEFEQVVELVFQNVQYLLTVALAPGDTLCVEAEHKTDGSRWRGDFTSRYIEEITRKTGNFKTFTVFVKMLRSAILQESDSVFVDLLTYQDLEMLKNKKSRGIGVHPCQRASNNKRYLILTYTGEFDRVHYPLPLLYEENPEPEALKRTIRRLRDELEEVKSTLQKKLEQTHPPLLNDEDSIQSIDSGTAELPKLREENARLKAQLTCMEDSYRLCGHISPSDWREVADDRKTLEKELALTRKKCDLLLSRVDAKKDSRKETQMLQARLDQLQGDLQLEHTLHRKAVAQLAKDNAALNQEVRSVREAERRLRVKLRESESELDLLKRRIKVQGARDLPPSRTRPSHSRPRSSSPSLLTKHTDGHLRGSRRPSPLSSHANTPIGSQPSSRPSSCPSFGTRGRLSAANLRAHCQEYKGLQARQSQPSSTRSTDPYSRRIMQKMSIFSFQSSSMNQFDLRSRTPSPQRSQTNQQPLHEVGTNVTSGLALTPGLASDDDAEVYRRYGSRASSPGRILRDVKAKLQKYAKMEGIELSHTESPDTRSVDYNYHSSGVHFLEILCSLVCLKCQGALCSKPHHLELHTVHNMDAEKEVTDIDLRLHALQNFLKSAKASAAKK